MIRSIAFALTIVALGAALSVLIGCGATHKGAQSPAGEALEFIALAVDASSPVIVQAYDDAKDGAISSSATVPEAEAKLHSIRSRWAIIWDAHDALRLAHDTYATAVEDGELTPALITSTRDSYCFLRYALTEFMTLPDFPLVGCAK